MVICCFGWSWCRKSSLTQICSWKTIILIAFLGNCECSPLILHWTNDGFLKVSCNMEFETIPVKFSSAVTLKPISQPCTLNKPFTYVWFCNKLWSSGECWFTELCRSSKYSHITLCKIKITFVSITKDLLIRVFKDSSSSLWWRIQDFQNSNFRLQVWVLSLVTNIIVLLKVTGSLCSFEKRSTK